MLNPSKKQKIPYISKTIGKNDIITIAATDHMKAVPDMIKNWMPGKYVTLGTDGFGRSDSREALRKHFEVDRYFITIAALKALEENGDISVKIVKSAIKKYKIDTEKNNPLFS